MAQKYRMKYTGEEVETLLDLVKGKVFLKRVSELPDPAYADLDSFYICKQIFYYTDGVEWLRVAPDEIEYSTRLEFPNVGKENVLYMATDEQVAYYWDEDHYVPVKGFVPDIDIIMCGGA